MSPLPSSLFMSLSTRLHSAKNMFMMLGRSAPLIHGILLDQPVGVAIDAGVRVVQAVGRGLFNIVYKVHLQRP